MSKKTRGASMLHYDPARACYIGRRRGGFIAVAPDLVAAKWAGCWRRFVENARYCPVDLFWADDKAREIALSVLVYSPELGKNPGVMWLADWDQHKAVAV